MTIRRDVDTEPLLLGRGRQLADFDARLAALDAGRGGLLWLRGEAGIGKTRLMAGFEQLAAPRATVLHGHGWEDASTPPFWLWTQVLRDAAAGRAGTDLAEAWGSRSSEAVSLLEHRALDAFGSGSRFPLFESVGSVLRVLARDRPVVVLLDDVHWADPASLELLRFLTGDLAHQPVLLVCGWRDQDVLGSERRLIDPELLRGDVSALTGLDADDVASLIRQTSGLVVTPEDAAAVHDRTGGNPLFIGEMARLADARGAVVVSTIIPDSAEATIRRRLARLSQSAHELLGAAAVLGSAPLELLARLVERPRPDISADVDAVVDAGLGLIEGDRWVFAHELIRDAVYDGLAPGRRTHLHHRAAELVAGSGPVPDQRAAEVTHHLMRCRSVVPADRIVQITEQAARAASRSQAWEETVRLYDQVLDFVGPESPERPRLLVAAGMARLDAGNLDGARELYLEAAAIARAADDGEVFARAALGFAAGLSGFEVRLFDRAQTELLAEALRRLPPDDSTLRAAVLARLSVGSSFAESAARRAELAEDAVAMSERIGDQMTLGVALSALCDAKAGPDHVDFRVEASTRIVEVARATADPALELLGLRLRVVARLEAGWMSAALGDMRSFEAISERLRQPLYAWYVPLWRGLRAHLAGDVARMEACADEAARIGSLADSANADMLAIVQRSWARRIGGTVSDGMNLLVEGLGDLLDQSPEVSGLMSLLPDRPSAERAAALDRLADIVANLAFDKEWLPNLAHFVECVHESDTRDPRIAIVYDALAPYGQLCSVDGIGAVQMGSIERHLGILADLLDRPEAAGHFEAALAANAAIGPLPVAQTQLAYAAHLARRSGPGDDVRRRELLTGALDFYRQAGVPSRVEEIAAALGGIAPEVPRPRTASSLKREGQLWALEFRGTPAHVPAVKGMADLAVLLARPETEVHVLDLVGEGTTVHQHEIGEVLDEQARASYRRRLAELDVDLEEADLTGDQAAGERAQSEREALLHELGAATGLGGRRRRAGDNSERARTTVTSRIKDAIKRIEEVHPELARHLRASVRTGTFCSYTPEQPETWQVEPTT